MKISDISEIINRIANENYKYLITISEGNLEFAALIAEKTFFNMKSILEIELTKSNIRNDLVVDPFKKGN